MGVPFFKIRGSPQSTWVIIEAKAPVCGVILTIQKQKMTIKFIYYQVIS